STPHQPFSQILRSKLANARLIDILKVPTDRIVHMGFRSDDQSEWGLVCQLTGKAANLLLLDNTARVVDTLRTPKGQGQNAGEVYQAPPSHPEGSHAEMTFSIGESPSASADAYFAELDALKAWETRAKSLRGRLQQRLRQKRNLVTNLQGDLATHGDP